MYAEIEPSGIHVRDGLVAVRFSFYCEEGDPRYDEHHIQLEDKTWQNNPFHNHFDLVSADITDDELKQLMEKRLKDFGKAWSEGFASDVRGVACEQIQKGWDTNDKHNKTKADFDRCAIKGLDIVARKDNFKRVK